GRVSPQPPPASSPRPPGARSTTCPTAHLPLLAKCPYMTLSRCACSGPRGSRRGLVTSHLYHAAGVTVPGPGYRDSSRTALVAGGVTQVTVRRLLREISQGSPSR